MKQAFWPIVLLALLHSFLPWGWSCSSSPSNNPEGPKESTKHQREQVTAFPETRGRRDGGGRDDDVVGKDFQHREQENTGGGVINSGRAGASVHYYFYKGLGMKRCPGRIAGYSTQAACDRLGRSQTENGAVNQVGLSCDPNLTGCIVGDKLMVTATIHCPKSPNFVRITYKKKTVTVRIVDRTPGNGGFDLGLDPYIDLGIYADFRIGVTGPKDIFYECLKD